MDFRKGFWIRSPDATRGQLCVESGKKPMVGEKPMVDAKSTVDVKSTYSPGLENVPSESIVLG